MIDYAAEPTCGDITNPFQFGRAAKEYHLAVGKRAITGLRHIAEQGIAGSVNMVRYGIFGNGNIFHPAGCSTCLSEVDGLAFPENVLPAFLD